MYNNFIAKVRYKKRAPTISQGMYRSFPVAKYFIQLNYKRQFARMGIEMVPIIANKSPTNDWIRRVLLCGFHSINTHIIINKLYNLRITF